MRAMYPIEPPISPMLARAAGAIPHGEGWLYEPKWDGFRAVVFRDGARVHIGSRNQLALERYFPDLLEPLSEALPERAVVDGEIVVPGEHGLDWDALSQRIHPAASRVAMLAGKTPAWFVAFDLLAEGDADLRGRPLAERRGALVEAVGAHPQVALTPQTADAAEAERWFLRFEGAGLDGVVAKRAEQVYVPGERVMVKVKHVRTADCVVGGYRVSSDGEGVGSLLLGLYDNEGVLHHVGHTSSFDAAERRTLRQRLRPLEGGSSFGTGRTPGAPSRWARSRDTSWVALQPSLVCEVSFDQLQGGRFRHASRLLRWRPDRSPDDCTYAQLDPPHPFALGDIVELGRRS